MSWLACFSQDKSQAFADRLFHSGEYEKAIPALKQCLNTQPYDISVQKMLAKSFFNTGYIDSAYIVYKEIVAYHNPDDYDTYAFLGNYYYVKANKLANAETIPDEKKTKTSRFKKEEEKIESAITAEYYIKASEYLEKAYTIYGSDEIKKSLIDIFIIVGNKDKATWYKSGKKRNPVNDSSSVKNKITEKHATI